MDEIIPTFASPLTRSAAAPIGMLAAAFHKGAIRRLGTSVRDDAVATALFTDHLAPMAEELPIDGDCWLPELGSMLSRVDTSAIGAVAHALMALHVLGLSGEWACALDRRDSFSVQGYVFALSGDLRVSSDGERIRIRSDEGSLVFERQGGRWLPVERHHNADLRAPAFFARPDLSGAYAQGWLDPTAQGVMDPIVEWPPEALPDGNAGLPEQAAAGFDSVFASLEEAGPYLDWIKPLFRGIAVSPPVIDGRSYSSSHVRHPGVFSCVFPYGTEQLGEVTVHEMSHQYFLLINAIFPLTVPDHDRLYFSSLKGKPRTLDRVLLAYHASANMTLYWHDRIRVAGHTPQRQREFDIMVDHTRDLTAQIDGADGLTPAGAALYATQKRLISERMDL